VRDLLGAGLGTFARSAQFSGRSRRTELFGLWAVLTLANLPLILFGAHAVPASVWFGLNLIGALPMPALFVRRVHDVGWSGWWLLPLIPLTATNIWRQLQWLQAPYEMPPQLSWWVHLALAPVLLALIALLLWDDEDGANRFGQNPRAEL